MVLTLATPISEIELVPSNALRLKDVTGSGYLALLQELGENRSTRLTYSNEIVEIRTPGQLHEVINRLLAAIILTLADSLDLVFNNLGSTTFNRADLTEGIEPDSCFYIQNVDIANSSASKLAVYKALGVPEIGLYSQGNLTVKTLTADGYSDVENSLAFRIVSAAQLNGWLKLGETGTDLTMIQAVRQEINALNET
ncbi:hypothetical protein [Leptothoe sp. PORK10 BA2]|uniref:hypothetical protein n=1 Tax=Leptothoe sp. PORK10 BA2 TaxID=3110254 RepID=UPI002B2133E9|nr:hypothetical protein [Leptothoe sp. PORK10 BA2]MEA5465557.1 hypothetical protein [Leptothoe sp. PORK10 BA2]